ncbi:tyrosyl-DNA phosphodiesterase 2-like isoform X2 [Hylaeus volcanicus]|nr:tyrosyl-DNA phosphodiesterase 2-like isoform X2 [Hylaeus volcanicus]
MKEQDKKKKKDSLLLTDSKVDCVTTRKTKLKTMCVQYHGNRTHQGKFMPCLPQSDPRVDYLLGRRSTGSQLCLNPTNGSLESDKEKKLNDSTLNSFFAPKKKTRVSQLKIVSWNIDGLNSNNLIDRTKSILATLTKIHPDVIYLQEVIDSTFEMIGTILSPTYHPIRCEIQELYDAPYYCVLLLLKTKFKASSDSFQMKTLRFPESQMGRHLLFVTCDLLNDTEPVCFLTAHLESCTESRNERVNQMQTTFLEMFRIVNDNEASLCIFGGDLNIRDKEAKCVLKTMETMGIHLVDIWEYLGSDSSTRYTWDSSYYSEDSVKRFYVKMRLDRMYLYTKKDSTLLWRPIAFQLIGKEKLPSTGKTPSDHLGLFVTFERSSYLQDCDHLNHIFKTTKT